MMVEKNYKKICIFSESDYNVKYKLGWYLSVAANKMRVGEE